MRCYAAYIVLAIFGSTLNLSAKDLREAVRAGDVERVTILLESGADPNSSYENSFTPIYFADKLEVVELLLAHGAKLDVRDRALIQSPLENAAEHFTWDAEHRDVWKTIVERLRKAGAEYTIDAAIYMNDIKFVQDELANDASWVNNQRKAQMLPLQLAARTGRVEICKLLLEHKADPDAFNEGDGFPIMFFAVNHPDVVKVLIEHGANLRRRITFNGCKEGWWSIEDEASILHFAVQRGNLESVKVLVEAGVDPNATDISGQTPLHVAVKQEPMERAYREAFEPDRKTPSSFEPIIKYLIEHDASLKLRDKQARTPQQLAEELDCPDSVIRLLEEGERRLR